MDLIQSLQASVAFPLSSRLPRHASVACNAEPLNGPISVNPSFGASKSSDPVTAASQPTGIKASFQAAKGLWTRCEKCGVILYVKHLKVRLPLNHGLQRSPDDLSLSSSRHTGAQPHLLQL